MDGEELEERNTEGLKIWLFVRWRSEIISVSAEASSLSLSLSLSLPTLSPSPPPSSLSVSAVFVCADNEDKQKDEWGELKSYLN